MSGAVNAEFIERYQLELEKNPRSRVFAPLAEAYRKMGLLDEALRICRIGIQANPEFAGGRVAYSKVLIESKSFAEALAQLEKAVQISPDNLLAHSLMGDTLLELRRPKEALKAFKMVLFFNPEDEKARQAVRKWEFLTAEEFDDEAFEMRPVFRANMLSATTEPPPPSVKGDSVEPNPTYRNREIERAVSLADAYTVRNDLGAAVEVLENARRALGPAEELENRLRLLSKRTQALIPDSAPMVSSDASPSAASDSVDHQRQILEKFLRRINERRLG